MRLKVGQTLVTKRPVNCPCGVKSPKLKILGLIKGLQLKSLCCGQEFTQTDEHIIDWLAYRPQTRTTFKGWKVK